MLLHDGGIGTREETLHLVVGVEIVFGYQSVWLGVEEVATAMHPCHQCQDTYTHYIFNRRLHFGNYEL